MFADLFGKVGFFGRSRGGGGHTCDMVFACFSSFFSPLTLQNPNFMKRKGQIVTYSSIKKLHTELSWNKWKKFVIYFFWGM